MGGGGSPPLVWVLQEPKLNRRAKVHRSFELEKRKKGKKEDDEKTKKKN
jgi:hypothetical protein